MKRMGLLLALCLIVHAALSAQPLADAYQQLTDIYQQRMSSLLQLAGTFGARGGITITPVLRGEPGKPFSATVTDTTTQTYLDGMHVVRTTTTLEYRDAEGRTRMERSGPGGNKTIVIRDPVAGVSYNLDPANRSGVKAAIAQPAQGGGRRGSMIDGPDGNTVAPTGGRTSRGGSMFDPNSGTPVATTSKDPNTLVEDLGTNNVNGVSARGTRVTTIVPVGAIGNDREFRSVSERWFSSDLNLLVKSVSTDPRFGTTTYELTNINRSQPDPLLFRPPSDYGIR